MVRLMPSRSTISRACKLSSRAFQFAEHHVGIGQVGQRVGQDVLVPARAQSGDALLIDATSARVANPFEQRDRTGIASLRRLEVAPVVVDGRERGMAAGNAALIPHLLVQRECLRMETGGLIVIAPIVRGVGDSVGGFRRQPLIAQLPRRR